MSAAPSVREFTAAPRLVCCARLPPVRDWYDDAALRFPFTFMGILSLALGLWIFLYFIIARPDGPVSGGIEVAAGFVMIGFGSYVIWRRLRGKES